MRYGSLFSGIGGFDLGFDRAGWDCAFQVEIDKYCNKILNERFPDIPRYQNVEEVTREQLSSHGAIDALVGGFPCQDISLAGRRAGLAGKRSGLFYSFMRLVADLAPRWVLIENVPGLLSSGKRRDMGAVLGTLGDLGYGYAYRVLDSQFFGLAQRRKRLFIVGHLGTPWSAAPQVLLERESSPWDPPPSREARTPAASIARGGASGHNQGDVVPALTSKMAKGTGGPSGDEAQNLVLFHDEVPSLSEVVVRSDAHVLSDGRDDVAATLNSGGNAGGFRTEPGEHLVVEQHQEDVFAFAENQRAELRTSEISLQLNAGGGKPGQGYGAVYERGRYAVHNGDDVCVSEDAAHSITGSKGNPGAITDVGVVRKLTPMECERLQGFPDGWTESISDSRRYRALGNAVSVPVAEWIAKRMAAQ